MLTSIVPIFGTRRLDQVKKNLGAAEVSLSDEDMAAIEARLAGIEIIGERLPPDLLKVTYRYSVSRSIAELFSAPNAMDIVFTFAACMNT
jgi:hypothetical protein